jgi:PST family polysaccharide transporter
MGPLTISVGKANWEFRWSVVTMVVSLVVFPLALRWGIVGVATAYLLMLCVLNPIRFKIIQRLIPISARSYLRSVAPAISCSAVLAIVWLATEAVLQRSTGELVQVATASLMATLGYVAALRIGWPDDLRRQLDFAKLVLRGART